MVAAAVIEGEQRISAHTRPDFSRGLEVVQSPLITSQNFLERMLPGEPIPQGEQDVAPELHLPWMKEMIQAVKLQQQAVFRYSDDIRVQLLAIGEGAQFSDAVVRNAYQRRRSHDATKFNEKAQAEAGARGFYDPVLDVFDFDLAPNGSYARLSFNLKQLHDDGKYPTVIVHRQPPGRRRFSYDDHAIMRIRGYENNDRLVRASGIICPATEDEPEMYLLDIATQDTPLAVDEAATQTYLAQSESDYKAAGEQSELWKNMQAAYFRERMLWREQLRAVNADITILESARIERRLTEEEEERLSSARTELDRLKEESQQLDQRPSAVAAAETYLQAVKEAQDEVLRRQEEEMKTIKLRSFDGENWERLEAA